MNVAGRLRAPRVAALYLLAHVAFRWRNVRTLNRQRLACAALLVALVPAALELAALAALALVGAVLAALIVYEAVRFAEARDRIRHQLEQEPAPSTSGRAYPPGVRRATPSRTAASATAAATAGATARSNTLGTT